MTGIQFHSQEDIVKLLKGIGVIPEPIKRLGDMVGVPVYVTPVVPKNDIWLVQDGRIVDILRMVI